MWRDRSLCAVSVGFGRMAAFSSKRVTGTGIEAAGSSGFGCWIQLQRTVVVADRRASECEGGVAGAARRTLEAGAGRVLQSARSDSEGHGVQDHRRHCSMWLPRQSSRRLAQVSLWTCTCVAQNSYFLQGCVGVHDRPVVWSGVRMRGYPPRCVTSKSVCLDEFCDACQGRVETVLDCFRSCQSVERVGR